MINTNFYQKKLVLFYFVFPAKNVLMKGRRILLADFDTAMRLLNEVTEKGLERRGTEGFISPEVCTQISTMPLSNGNSKNRKMLSHSLSFPEEVNLWVTRFFF